mmetsp:Transcript_1076/g.2966  ORF Transcript_1076/g.2966 Transcript_1076/m.2966 type:complete len:240 (+) Transcript_1076:1280-1999(+)
MSASSAMGSRPMYSAYSRVSASHLEFGGATGFLRAAGAPGVAAAGEEGSGRHVGLTSCVRCCCAALVAALPSEDWPSRAAEPARGALMMEETMLLAKRGSEPRSGRLLRSFSSSMRFCSTAAASWRKRTCVCSRQKSRSHVRSSTRSSCTRRSASRRASWRRSSAERRAASACHLALVASASALRFSAAAFSRASSSLAFLSASFTSASSSSRERARDLCVSTCARSSPTSSGDMAPAT